MNAGELRRRIIAALNAAGIRHMLTGSFASAYHGSPRATQDIDFVIEADEDQLRAFVRSLPSEEYYADEDAAIEALRDQTQFNVIDLRTGWKIDLVIRKSRPFSVEEFGRRQLVELDGVSLAVATAEDMIVAKLEWPRAGNSTRQVQDVASIVRIRASEIDMDRVEHWIAALGLQTEGAAARSLAGLSG